MGAPRGTYHIWTVGCQMNMADSQRVQGILDSLGWQEVPAMDQANLVVLNTCSVRQAPEERAHGQLSLLRRAKQQRADLLVAMMGCMIGNQKTIDSLQQRYPQVDLFFKVEQADILPRFLEERWTPLVGEGCVTMMDDDEPAATAVQTNGRTVLPMAITPRPGERTAHYPAPISVKSSPCAWLPVVLGCNKVCTYCIVPYRRGRERSRPVTELLAEANQLVANGARELTLLGQTVEAYGLDLPERPDLGDLMARLSAIPELARIRFMTSYPRDMTDKMIHQMATLPKVCEHVNIPVQSGDDAVLQRMKRGYTIDEYRALIAKLRAWWPGVSLSTDVIVGFCGETEEEFQRTLELLEEIRFDVVHVAMYSPRPGTLAAKWEDDIPLAEKKRRLHAVEEVQARIAGAINAGYVGRTEEVLIEERQVQRGRVNWRGRTRTNKLVFFPEEITAASQGRADTATPMQPGMLVLVQIEKATPWSLQGCMVQVSGDGE
jgi:tRNA-2-methylthio-N6-dimethylallyladenosine synthase